MLLPTASATVLGSYQQAATKAPQTAGSSLTVRSTWAPVTILQKSERFQRVGFCHWNNGLDLLLSILDIRLQCFQDFFKARFFNQSLYHCQHNWFLLLEIFVIDGLLQKLHTIWWHQPLDRQLDRASWNAPGHIVNIAYMIVIRILIDWKFT